MKNICVLIVCRGPIRKEAMDVFSSLGVEYGILLSEKDSSCYSLTLAPELRSIPLRERVHLVKDYSGGSEEERRSQIAEILAIASQNGYTHIFAGYGFMAEDADFVEQIEGAGIGFIGPSSRVHRLAGAKDSAKKIARQIGVSVTPGVDNISAITLLKKAGGKLEGLRKIAQANKLKIADSSDDPINCSEALLEQGYRQGIGLIGLKDLQKEACYQAKEIFKKHKGKRIRLKHIGGGGGKGQRIVSSIDQVSNAVLETLSEAKALGEAGNKNFLMELNIEGTRHNEIQLLGNGKWCIALGGRDCSLQMHEQKLVELSITDELFEHEIARAKKQQRRDVIETLQKDRELLGEMEKQAENFGRAIGLNSASTFEMIVSEGDFFFMEMNTRIQVEHGVTEMVYGLRFYNPDDQKDFFDIHSLLQAMTLIAVHGDKLPPPRRIVHNISGGEVRLNAQNDALQPSAGGIIEYWSLPLENELRDDQGIGTRNPDSGQFIRHHLAGAYDSNIALIINSAAGRRENLAGLADILRQMKIYGEDVSTNRDFHYGILQFCLGLHPMIKPSTHFVRPYLAAVGSLATQLCRFDFDFADLLLRKKIAERCGSTIAKKRILLLRPLKLLSKNPHLAAGWLMLNYRRAFDISIKENVKQKKAAQGAEKEKREESDRWQIHWRRNPLMVVEELYHFLNLQDSCQENPQKSPQESPIERIWPEDQALLREGILFYKELEERLQVDTKEEYRKSQKESSSNSSDSYQKLDQNWQDVRGLLDLFILLGHRSAIFEFGIDKNLEPQIPKRFMVEEEQKQYLSALAPPPPRSAETIVALSGGTFYSKETPQAAPYLQPGSRFEIGDPIYIIEVMKMFNKVYAEFSGTVEEILVDGERGEVIKRGQALFRVKPDQAMEVESPQQIERNRERYTRELVQLL